MIYVNRFTVIVVALGIVFALALPTFAQKTPQAGTHITVSKGGGGMYSTVQTAVNEARPGQVIEILDAEVYEEQVTIFGNDIYVHGETPPWPEVAGGKHDITIRYVPTPGSTARPVIKYHDVTNRSPINNAQSLILGYATGQAGNWQTCAAVRVLNTSGITIEGIVIDGGGSAPFYHPTVWSNPGGTPAYTELAHGNAAISLVNSGSIQIRDCEIRNAFFGIYVKDRNLGGIFANPNPGDMDETIPLSNFGQSGNHIIEYNRIGENEQGIYFESLWDLGSTIRYNLIYHNIIRDVSVVGYTGTGGQRRPEGLLSAGLYFKDNYLSPVAIHNNTFFQNDADILGGWQVGYQHLIFNNIFNRTGTIRKDLQIGLPSNEKFPQRMKNNVFTANGYDVYPSSPYPFPSGSNNHWWMSSSGGMFVSTIPANPNFLVPLWTSSPVGQYIRNGGWSQSGIINEDGTVADLGAIPFEGKRPMDGMSKTSRAKITPTGAVTINGTQATAKFSVNQEIASAGIDNLTIKYLRWIAPLPDNRNSFGTNGKIITAEMINVIGSRPVVPGSNELTFTVPALPAIGEQYGFFELVIGGTDAVGRPITTDVGFLPYRRLNQYFDVQAFKDGQPITAVTAGEPVTIRVTAMNGTTGEVFTRGINTRPLKAAFSLLSNPAARMMAYVADGRCTPDPCTGPQPLTHDDDIKTDGAYWEEYTVYFTHAGNEVVSVAGLLCDAATCAAATAENRLGFLGNLNLTVRPREVDGAEAPARVVFLSPPSNAETTIRGYHHVAVQVQDIYGNAVNTPVRVDIVSSNTSVGTISPAYLMTDSANGIAQFVAQTAPDAPGGALFDLTASVNIGGETVLDRVTLKVEKIDDVIPPPRVVSGGYEAADNYIHTTRLMFDREVTHDLFSTIRFQFGITPANMTNTTCLEVNRPDAYTVAITMGCGFPGTHLVESRGNNSNITINYNSTMGWAPQTVTIANGKVVSVSVKESARVIPDVRTDEGAAVVIPTNLAGFELTVGPNPTRRGGILPPAINIFITGKRIDKGELTVYDAVGNAVRKINVNDELPPPFGLPPLGGGQNVNGGRRIIGQWNLRDARGRPVSEGVYLLRGVIKTIDGRRERVSVVVGVSLPTNTR